MSSSSYYTVFFSHISRPITQVVRDPDGLLNARKYLLGKHWYIVRADSEKEAVREAALLAAGAHPKQEQIEKIYQTLRKGDVHQLRDFISTLTVCR